MSAQHPTSNSQLLGSHGATGCEWQQNDDGLWETGCGNTHVIIDGGPIANNMKYCCYCGLCLDELPYSEPEDMDDE